MNEGQIVRRTIGYTILAVILTGGITLALWGFGVLFAGPKGAGDAYKVKQSATNRIAKQEMFEQLTADIDGYTAKISAAQTAVAEAKVWNSGGSNDREELAVTNADHIELYRDDVDEYRWRAKAANGEIIAQSEGYSRKDGAIRAATDTFPGTPILEIEAE